MISKQDIIDYFKSLDDNNPEGFAPDDCNCEFKYECSKSGGACLCEVITNPDLY